MQNNSAKGGDDNLIGGDTLIGGNNSGSGNVGNNLQGDAFEMFDNAQGGDDTLIGGETVATATPKTLSRPRGV